jgi:hypothetical protein
MPCVALTPRGCESLSHQFSQLIWLCIKFMACIISSLALNTDGHWLVSPVLRIDNGVRTAFAQCEVLDQRFYLAAAHLCFGIAYLCVCGVPYDCFTPRLPTYGLCLCLSRCLSMVTICVSLCLLIRRFFASRRLPCIFIFIFASRLVSSISHNF